ncbi:hypothetical protein LZ32DRAFT_146870 [Colletotrichum eremochloae]|nr:hypothetical protein LZ32DRAFT_146870 [Colletotrichum eremochloae]
MPLEHSSSQLASGPPLNTWLKMVCPNTRGVFRVSGSVRIVNAIFDYYCYEKGGEEVTGTIRCPTLPLHIDAGAQDVASAFKKFISVLPGGILGSLSLFDALVAIHSQLRKEPELSRTKDTKLRARLIALAIGTVKSQFRRELICAVFGLLSLIGRAAETAAREDEQGRPLPTSDLMGYTALGIVFGPLLLGDLLDSYTMRLAYPSSGLLLFPLTPPQIKKERQRKIAAQDEGGPLSVDKIRVANDIAEMLITNWREVVRNMKNLSILARTNYEVEKTSRREPLRSSNSEPFAIGLPKGWKSKRSSPATSFSRDRSPSPTTPTPAPRSVGMPTLGTTENLGEVLNIKRVRPKTSHSASSNKLSMRQSPNPLSPTAEESLVDDMRTAGPQFISAKNDSPTILLTPEKKPASQPENSQQISNPNAVKIRRTPRGSLIRRYNSPGKDGKSLDETHGLATGHDQISTASPRLSAKMVPSRTSSRQPTHTLGELRSSTENLKDSKQSKEHTLFGKDGGSAEGTETTGRKTRGTVSSALRRLLGNSQSRTSNSTSPGPKVFNTMHLSPEVMSPRTPTQSTFPSETANTRDVTQDPPGSICGISTKHGDNDAARILSESKDKQDPGTESKSFNISRTLHTRPIDMTLLSDSPLRTPRQDEEFDSRSESTHSIQTTPRGFFAKSEEPVSSRAIGTDSSKPQ